MKARDTVSVSALRSALAAIENAEAVDATAHPPGTTESSHFAGSVAGLGHAEVERRGLSEPEVEQIVRTEADERQSAAREVEGAGHHQRAARLRAEAEVLLRYVQH
jgi:uncharacterized protein YqeY